MAGTKPDFFIVGAPKSGTTAMYGYLRHHPELYLPPRKELRYFGSDLDIRDRRPLVESEYLAQFAAGGSASHVGTAYVWYLYSRAAAREIADFAPSARIVAMLRSPIEMLHALHGEHLSNGNEDIRDFTEAFEAEGERRAGRRIPPHSHLPQGLWYSSVPRYTEQLERYVQAFGRERLHVILYDDFAADPKASYSELLRFLEVRDDVLPDEFAVINASKRTRSERLRHFLARPPDFPRRVIRSTVPARVRRALYRRAQRLNVTEAPREPVPHATRERLRQMFVEECERLSAFLDRDVTHWTAPSDLGPSQPASGAAEHALADGE